MRRPIPVFVALCALISTAPGFAANEKAATPGASPWRGTWTLDHGASKLASASLLQLKLDVAQADPSLVKFTLEGTMANGTETRQSYEGKPDGALHPVLEKGKPVAQSSYRFTSDRVMTGEATDPTGKKETMTLELAADGKSLTETRHVKIPQGEYDETMVFRK